MKLPKLVLVLVTVTIFVSEAYGKETEDGESPSGRRFLATLTRMIDDMDNKTDQKLNGLKTVNAENKNATLSGINENKKQMMTLVG